jgi:hypothetical protein
VRGGGGGNGGGWGVVVPIGRSEPMQNDQAYFVIDIFFKNL